VIVIGCPKHFGHVCGAGKFVRIQQFFGPSSAHNTKAQLSDIRAKLLADMQAKLASLLAQPSNPLTKLVLFV